MSQLNPIKVSRFAWKILNNWYTHRSESSIGLLQQYKEIVKLLKLNRLEPEEYYRYNLYNKNFSWEDKIKYLSDNQYYLIESLMNPRKEVGVLNKLVFRTYSSYFGLPMPELYGVFVPHLGYTADGGRLCTVDDLKSLFDNPNISEFIIKPISGSEGKGIIVCKNNHNSKINILGEGEISIDDLYSRLIQSRMNEHNLHSNVFVIEKFIKQHSFLDNYCKSVAQGVRVLTYIASNGKIEVVTVHLKIAFSGKFIDNIGDSGIAVLVDNNGILDRATHFSPQGLKKYDHHPETNFPITGQKLPFYKETIELAIKAQSFLPQLRFIGWDLAITSDGPVFIEGNHGWGHIAMQQVEKEGFIRGCIKNDLYELMRTHG